jgi:predicted transcriptional regulator
MDTEMKNAINECHTLSRCEKKILAILNEINYPLPASHIQDLMNNSKQALHYPLQKLLKKEFVERSKDGVYLYALNESKIKTLVDLYKKTKRYKQE